MYTYKLYIIKITLIIINQYDHHIWRVFGSKTSLKPPDLNYIYYNGINSVMLHSNWKRVDHHRWVAIRGEVVTKTREEIKARQNIYLFTREQSESVRVTRACSLTTDSCLFLSPYLQRRRWSDISRYISGKPDHL